MLAEVDDREAVVQEGLEMLRFGGRYFTAPELTGRRSTAVTVLSWPHDQRRIPMVQIMREEAQRAFRAWREKGDRVEY